MFPSYNVDEKTRGDFSLARSHSCGINYAAQTNDSNTEGKSLFKGGNYECYDDDCGLGGCADVIESLAKYAFISKEDDEENLNDDIINYYSHDSYDKTPSSLSLSLSADYDSESIGSIGSIQGFGDGLGTGEVESCGGGGLESSNIYSVFENTCPLPYTPYGPHEGVQVILDDGEYELSTSSWYGGGGVNQVKDGCMETMESVLKEEGIHKTDNEDKVKDNVDKVKDNVDKVKDNVDKVEVATFSIASTPCSSSSSSSSSSSTINRSSTNKSSGRNKRKAIFKTKSSSIGKTGKATEGNEIILNHLYKYIPKYKYPEKSLLRAFSRNRIENLCILDTGKKIDKEYSTWRRAEANQRRLLRIQKRRKKSGKRYEVEDEEEDEDYYSMYCY